MDNEILLVGGFHEMIELCEQAGFIIRGIIDGKLKDTYYGYPVLGTDEDAGRLFSEYGSCKVVLTPDSPKVREKLERLYSSIGYDFATVVSPGATVSKYARIGKGAVVQDHVNVSAGTSIGRFAKLNTYCNIMHDNTIDDFTTVAPSAVFLGRIKVGKSAYIGANSTVLPELTIGENAVVGAGAVVTKDVEPGKVVAGVPARVLK